MTGNRVILGGLLALFLFFGPAPGVWPKGKASRVKSDAAEKWQGEEDSDADMSDQGEPEESSRFKVGVDDTYEDDSTNQNDFYHSKFKEDQDDEDSDTDTSEDDTDND